MFGCCKKTNMESEIAEQVKVLPYILEQYTDKETGKLNFNIPDNVRKVVIVASGSSYHCARFAVDLIEKIAKVETQAIYSSNFVVKDLIPHDEGTLYAFVTQSGETSDTLKSVEKVQRETKLPTICITNVENSTIWKMCDYQMACHAGVEQGIAATKSLSAQMLCFVLLALKLIENKEDISAYKNSLAKLGSVAEKVLAKRDEIRKLVKKFANENVIMITGDGLSYAIAKEVTLKIKETSYKNISAFILGEFMHGHVAVLNNPKSTFVYMASSKISERSVNNVLNIQNDYNPTVVMIGKSDDRIKPNYHIEVECDDELQYLFANVMIGQLIALETALKLKRNVDSPKGLHKVVVDNNI